jgi:hypothetical protein
MGQTCGAGKKPRILAPKRGAATYGWACMAAINSSVATIIGKIRGSIRQFMVHYSLAAPAARR